MNFKPLFNNILVERMEEETKTWGKYVEEMAKKMEEENNK